MPLRMRWADKAIPRRGRTRTDRPSSDQLSVPFRRDCVCAGPTKQFPVKEEPVRPEVPSNATIGCPKCQTVVVSYLRNDLRYLASGQIDLLERSSLRSWDAQRNHVLQILHCNPA